MGVKVAFILLELECVCFSRIMLNFTSRELVKVLSDILR